MMRSVQRGEEYCSDFYFGFDAKKKYSRESFFGRFTCRIESLFIELS